MSNGMPRLNELEETGVVVKTRANWDEERVAAGVYEKVALPSVLPLPSHCWTALCVDPEPPTAHPASIGRSRIGSRSGTLLLHRPTNAKSNPGS